MPSTLLTLDDPILRLIGYYINDDNFLPLPSFGPFWKNLPRPAPGSYSKSLRAFRAVSRRVREVVKLEGLHVRIENVEKMRWWIWDVPEEMKRAVRRLHLDIPPPAARPDPSPYARLKMSDTVVHLLLNLVSLEELEIYDLPCGSHRTHIALPTLRPSRDIRWPTAVRLDHIKALSLYLRCSICPRGRGPRDLMAHFPHLTNLKVIGFDEPLPSGQVVPLPGIVALPLLGALSQLTRLFVRSAPSVNWKDTLRVINAGCPGLVELHLSRFQCQSFVLFPVAGEFMLDPNPVEGWQLIEPCEMLGALSEFKALQVLDTAEEVKIEDEEDALDNSTYFATAESDDPSRFDGLIPASVLRKATNGGGTSGWRGGESTRGGAGRP